MAELETPRLRFVEPTSHAIRLILNTDTGWSVGEGLDLGGAGLEETTLSNETEDNEEVLSARRPRSVATLPLILTEQTGVAAIIALKDALTVELDRDTNCIEFRPEGGSFSYFFDSYRAPIPSLARGQRLLTECLLHDSESMPLVIRRNAYDQSGKLY